jgi:hypothetical protein
MSFLLIDDNENVKLTQELERYMNGKTTLDL